MGIEIAFSADMKSMFNNDYLSAANGEREMAIAASRKLFQAIQKQARPVKYEKDIPKPKLDFSDGTYHSIHNAYADSVAMMHNKRRSYKPSRSVTGEETSIELAAKKIAMARNRSK